MFRDILWACAVSRRQGRNRDDVASLWACAVSRFVGLRGIAESKNVRCLRCFVAACGLAQYRGGKVGIRMTSWACAVSKKREVFKIFRCGL